jgi:hypothetical protein
VLRQMNQTAPIVLIASFERQNEAANLVAEGKVEFVARQGNYACTNLPTSAVPKRPIIWKRQRVALLTRE